MSIIKRAKTEDSVKVTELILITAPYFPLLFGENIKEVLQEMFLKNYNLFSLKNVFTIENNKEITGMLLGYDWKTKKQSNLNTGILLLKKTRFKLLNNFIPLLKFNSSVGQFKKGEYYISNIAIYPEFRGKGLGRELIQKAEEDAKRKHSKKVVLDVEKENNRAIKFYKELGYIKVKEFTVYLEKEKVLYFYRMKKEI